MVWLLLGDSIFFSQDLPRDRCLLFYSWVKLQVDPPSGGVEPLKTRKAKQFMSYDYDLFVIGAGPGGIAAAKQVAADDGIRVAVAEQAAIGGTCVNRGCIPKKFLVYAADFALQNQVAVNYGWSDIRTSLDWSRLITAVHHQVELRNQSYLQTFQQAGIELIPGQAKFLDPHTLDVDGRKVTAAKILLAVGGHPLKPPIPGREHTITSDQLLQLQQLPKRLAIIGGGYIGVEFASIMHAFGVEVTLMDTDALILSGFDQDIRAAVQQGLSDRGIKILGNTTAKEIEPKAEELQLNLSGDRQSTITADTILMATGRAPNTKSLNLEAAGVEVGEKGEVIVDNYNRTSQTHIFAVGDCTNRIALTPVAKAEAHAFALTAFGNQPQQVEYKYVTSAVFARPEAATVGMTEAKAREEFGESVQSHKTEFEPLFDSMTDRNQQAMMKLVVDANSEQVLGAHMVGEHAADIIQSLAVAIRQGITKSEITATIGIHPSTAEEFLTID